ncbi:MAG: M20/M25/M40 family metallo-hydrolase [Planctomycetes bacterium]|nr:M20/M25/M40 family metallo-hydrolase [Planctomycetota bacterium]
MVLGPSANLSCRTVLLSGWLISSLGFVGNGAETTAPLIDRDLAAAVESIGIEELKTHISTLASDALQGREAGTAGGHAASAYLMQQLRRLGVAPAAADRQFAQEFANGMRNILASVPGHDAQRRDEVVIVAAHFDHVGFGTPRNSRGPIGYIHNGADDNASGVAGLLEIVEAVRKLPRPPRRTLLFAFWDGEEKGLLGSKHWLAAPTLPLSQVKLVINADMIGRLRPEGVEVTGTRAACGLRHIVADANSATIAPRLRLNFTWDMRADSDHHPFFAAGIPALMLHTGKHDDYHRPSDDADKLNYEGTQQLARLMLLLALQTAEADELPAFRSMSRGENKEQQRLVEQPLPSPAPRLGITWNSQLSEQGIVEITQISAQSPAVSAGLRIGDRIERFAGHAVSDAADFRSLVVIADRDVTATVRRPGISEPLELSVRLTGEPTRLGLTWRTDDAEPHSVILTQVIPHSAAALAGLKLLDRVHTFGGQAATNEHVSRAATSLPLPIAVTFERDGVISTTSIKSVTSTAVAVERDRAAANERR